MASNNSNDLSMLLVAKLSDDSETTIRKQLEQIQSSLKNKPIELNVSINKDSLKNLQQIADALKQIASLQGKVSSVGVNVRASSGTATPSRTIPESMDMQQRINALAAFQDRELKVLQAGYDQKRKAAVSYDQFWSNYTDKQAQDVEKNITSYDKEAAGKQKASDVKKKSDMDYSNWWQTQMQKQDDDLVKEIGNLDKEDAAKIAAADKSRTVADKMTQAQQADYDARRKSEMDYVSWWEGELNKELSLRQKEVTDIEAANQKKKKSEMDYIGWWEQALQKEDSVVMKDAEMRKKEADQVQKIADDKAKAAEKQTKDAAKAAQKESDQSFGGRLAKNFDSLAIWTGAATMMFGTLHAVQDGIKQITAIDSAMTDLKKVTDETSKSYQDFSREANVMAHNLGTGTVEIIKATAEFARFGYNMTQAKQLAGAANLYANVGGMDSTAASQAIISTIKGFGIEVDAQGQNVQHVVDVYNEVGNHFSITSAGIGEAVQRSASALKEAGNTFDETVALITGANAAVQDPEAVGTALKTVAMRLRGVDESGNQILGLTAQLDKQFGSIGLTVMKDNDTFKSTTEIMRELATKWQSLNDIQKADMLKTVAGARQGNVIAGMLQNWQDVEKVIQTAGNSMGSATRENATYMDSIEAKQKQAANAVTGFWQALVSGESIKPWLDMTTKFVEGLTWIIDTFGSIPTVAGVATAAIALFNKEALAATLQGGVLAGIQTLLKSGWEYFAVAQTEATVTSVENTAAQVANAAATEGVAVATNVASASMSRFGAAFAATGIGLAVMAITFALQALYKVYKDDQTAHDQRIKQMTEEVASNKKAEASLSSLADQYGKLQAKANLNTTDKQALKGIQESIAKDMPSLIAYYDSEGNAVYRDAAAVRDYVKAMHEKSAADAKQLASEGQNNYVDTIKAKKDLVPITDNANNARAYLQASEFAREFAKTVPTDYKAAQDAITKGNAEIIQIYHKFGADVGNAFDLGDVVYQKNKDQIDRMVQNAQDAVATADGKVNTFMDSNKGKLDQQKSNMENIAISMDTTISKHQPNMDFVKSAMINGMTDVLSRTKNLTTEKMKDVDQAFQDGWKAVIDLANSGKIDFSKMFDPSTSTEAFKQLEDALTKAHVAPEALQQIMGDLAKKIHGAATSGFELKNVYSDIAGIMNQSHQDLDVLANGYVTLKNGQALSYDQIKKMIEVSPQLAGQIKIIAGQVTLEKSAIYDAMIMRQDATKDQLKQNAIRVDDAIKAKDVMVKLALDEVNAQMTVAQARKASMDELSLMAQGTAITENGDKQNAHTAFAGKIRAQKLKDAIASYDITLDPYNEAKKALEGMIGSGNAFTQTAIDNAQEAHPAPKGPKAKKAPKAKQDTHQPYYVNEWEHEIAAIDLALARLNNDKKKYTETDKEWLGLQRQEIDLLKQKQQQYHLEADQNRALYVQYDQQMAQNVVHSKKWDDLAQKKDDARKKIESLQSNWESIQGSILDITDGKAKKNDWLTEVKKELADTQKLMDEQINQSQTKQALMDKNSTGYRDELHAQNAVLQQRVTYEDWVLKLLKEEQARLEERMKTEDMTGSVLQAVKARLVDVKGIIADTTKSISTQNETIAKNSQAWWDSIKAWRQQADALADKVVASYKEVQKQIHDAQITALDEVRKAEDTRHNDAVKNMDEEAKVYEQSVNDKIKDIDRVFQEEQDKKNLAKEDDVRSKLVTQIDKMALDNSVEGRAKLDDLKKQLKAQDDKMQDQRDKNTHDKRKSNLQEQLDTYKRNKTTEKQTEDDLHNTNVKHFDELKKQYDDIYDKAINNEDKIKKLRQAVFDGDMNYINEQVNSYFGAFDSIANTTMTGIGDKVRKQLDLAQNLKDLLDSVNGTNGQTALPAPPGTDDKNTQGNSGSSIIGNSGEQHKDANNVNWKKVQAYEQFVSNKIQAQDIYKKTGNWNDPQIVELSKQNQFFRENFKFEDMSGEQALSQFDTVKSGAWDRYRKDKRDWWNLFSQTGGNSSPDQLKLAEDAGRLRNLFGFADLSKDDLKLMHEIPFEQNERDRAFQKMIGNKLAWKKDNEKLTSTTDENEKEKIRQEMAALSSENISIRGSNGDIHDYSEAELQKLKVTGFSVGGYTGSWTGNGGRLIAVHPEEFVLNKQDTKNILAAAHAMRDLLSSPSLFQKQDAPAAAGVTIGSVNLTIERLNGDEQGGKTVFKTLVDELSRTRGVKL